MSGHKAVLDMPREKIREDYIERLASFWPEPRDQLHFGGWRATYELVEKLNLDTANHILDICCGEGGTACWLAKEYGRRVAGIDILKSAIKVAKKCAKKNRVTDLTDFRVADVFDLPFHENEFDVIYGLDPDGIAHMDRLDIFRECKRVLKSGGKLGFQHWLVHKGTPQEDIAYFETVTMGTGYPYMRRLTVDEYVMDLENAGFRDIVVEDLSEMYMAHTLKIKDKVAEMNKDLDVWHAMLLELYDKGVRIGARIIAETD
ncbi:MAG: SAM-dependent methyltransferase [Candidatus Thorarchaeota archaeon]